MLSQKMMKDRGYAIAPKSQKEPDSIEFTANNKKGILIFCDSDISINYVGTLKEMAENYEKVILVKSGKITPAANSAFKEFSVIKDFEIFDKLDLEYDITSHSECPRYSLLGEEEVKLLLKQYRLTKQQLPKMLYTDPIRRYYGWVKGSIVREETDDELYYRLVV